MKPKLVKRICYAIAVLLIVTGKPGNDSYPSEGI